MSPTKDQKATNTPKATTGRNTSAPHDTADRPDAATRHADTHPAAIWLEAPEAHDHHADENTPVTARIVDLPRP